MCPSRGWMLVLTLGALCVGCRDRVCTLIGCSDHVRVVLQPAVGTTYDVDLVVDGVEGSFTCTALGTGGWRPTDVSRAALSGGCTGDGFEILGTPESVEAVVSAQDGSWLGSLTDTPNYETIQPNGPDCPPTCRVAELMVSGELRSICTEWTEGEPLCVNGEIDPIAPCCELPAPPDVPDACQGNESLVNPTSCTPTGTVVTHRLTYFQVLGDCNTGYDLDRCNGRSCTAGGLATAEGAGGVDNALAGLAPVVDAIGLNLASVNQGFANSLCGGADMDETVEGCELDFPRWEITFAVDANPQESCANVTMFAGPSPVGSVVMNLSDDGCLAGTLPNIPVDAGGTLIHFSNVTLRTTVSQSGFSNGVMGATGDAVFVKVIQESIGLSAPDVGYDQLLDINDDLSGDPESLCNAMSGTYRIGGVVEP